MKKAIYAALLVLAVAAVAWNFINYNATQAEARATADSTIQDTGDWMDSMKEGRPYVTTCAVCKGKVSSDAKACPHCGDPR